MEPVSVAPIRTLDDLKKVLFIQKAVTQAAKEEMLALATDGVSALQPHEYIEAEKRLLEKYAKYPTLSEFSISPALTNVYKWGATFGVTTLVGGLIIEEVRVLQPHFTPVLRQLFFIMLKELDHPKHEFLIDPLEAALKVQIRVAPGRDANSDNARNFVRQMIAELIEAFVAVGAQFGLVSGDKGVSLTPVGKRVLLHLADASLFVQELGEAHAKFQSIKPKLSLM